MAPRIGLHDLLSDILASFGIWLWDDLAFDSSDIENAIITEAKRHVYYQPPENLKLTYPCIVYQRSGFDTKFADDKPYGNVKQYTLTVIDKNADSLISDKIIMLPKCRFERHFVVDRLHHDIFRIYY